MCFNASDISAIRISYQLTPRITPKRTSRATSGSRMRPDISRDHEMMACGQCRRTIRLDREIDDVENRAQKHRAARAQNE